MQKVELRLALRTTPRVLSARGSVEALLGYRPSDLLHPDFQFMNVLHPADAETLIRLVALDSEEGAVLRIRDADRRIHCVYAQARRANRSAGEPVVLLTLRPVNLLRPSAAQARIMACSQAVMECVEEGVHFKCRNHVYLRANQNFLRMISGSSIEPEGLTGLTDYDLFSEKAADELFQLENQVLSGAPVAHAVLEMENRDGKSEWLDVRKFPVRAPDGSIVGIFSFVTPITEGVLSMRALLETAESLKESQKIAGAGNYEIDLATGTWTVSEVIDEMLGIDASYPHTVDSWMALIHPDDRDEVIDYFTDEVVGKGSIFDREHRMIRRSDGQECWVHALGRLERNAKGEPYRIRGMIQNVTEHKKADAALRASRELLQLFIEHAPAALAMLDLNMRYLAVSRRWLEDHGLAEDQILGRSHYDIFPEVSARWREAYQRGLAGEGLRHEEDCFKQADGSVQWLRWELLPWRTQDGSVGGIIFFSEDITRLKKSEERLQLASNVFTHASEGIMVTDIEGTLLDVNEAFTRITGYTRDEVLGRNPRFLSSGRQSTAFYAEMWNQLTTAGHWSGEIWNRAKSGHIIAEQVTISSIPEAEGQPLQYVALFSDITSFKDQKRQLERISHYDPLTGLPNRTLLADRLHQAMAQAHRTRRHLAIACLDLDNFRSVNDSHGHDVGNELLTVLTRRMELVLREGDSLARLGGDEMVAVMLDLERGEDCLPLIEGLLKAVAKPAQIGNLTLSISASIGVTYFPQAEDVDADQLLRQADQAMYHAKLEGKGRFHVFDPSLDRTLRGRHEDQERFGLAIRRDELVLYFQPKVNMSTGAVLGVEALVRWQHPERGLLRPGQFLPMLEGSPVLVELGEWVLHSALRQIQEWRAQGLELPVSVNIDAIQLQEPGFVDRLRSLLAEHPGVAPSQLELEVLESSALEDVAHVSLVIRACSRMGVQFALDDFGTGYSSLTYLKRLPVHTLKIDQSFVRGMIDDPEDLTIVEGVLGLAAAFRLQPVAEGVESVEHGQLLLWLGCPVSQGNYIAEPMPGNLLPAWAAHWRPDLRWASVLPIDPQFWPVLYAVAEHRAWVARVEEYLHGYRGVAPVIDHHHCRLGGWLDSEATAGHGGRAVFQAMDTMHHQLHAFANSIVGLKVDNRTQIARAALPELHARRDALLEQLDAFVQSLSAVRGVPVGVDANGHKGGWSRRSESN